MKDFYFKDTPIYGDLFLDEVLLSYDNIPMIFTCKSGSSIRLLCVCVDIIQNQTWIMAEIDTKTLLEVLRDKISICKAFELSGGKMVIAEKINHSIEYTIQSYNEIDPMELPDPDEKLEMQDELYLYIQAIEFENLCLKLNLFIDSKRELKYSFTFNIKNITVDSTGASAGIIEDYSRTGNFDLEPSESFERILEPDKNLLNAA